MAEESGPGAPKALWAQVSGPLTRLPAKLGSQRGGITEVGVSRLTPLGLLLPPPLSAKSQAASTVTHAVVGLLDQRGNNDQQKTLSCLPVGSRETLYFRVEVKLSSVGSAGSQSSRTQRK